MLSTYLLTAAHVSLNPNMGAFSGGYFHTTMRVPHGAPGLHTTKLVVDVPHGILVVKPEVPEDWTAAIETRFLAENEQYTSHGQLKTTAPHRVILTANTHADGVHDDHLLNVDMQLKVGCTFEDRASNTQWNSEYTLWWQVSQECEDASGNKVILDWNGTQVDADGVSPSWSALPAGMKPAPYMYVEPGTRCTNEHTGTEAQGGMNWFGAHVADESNAPMADPVMSSMEVCNFILSLIALILAVSSTSCLIGATFLRCTNKKRFAEQLIGVPLQHEKGMQIHGEPI